MPLDLPLRPPADPDPSCTVWRAADAPARVFVTRPRADGAFHGLGTVLGAYWYCGTIVHVRVALDTGIEKLVEPCWLASAASVEKRPVPSIPPWPMGVPA